MIIIFKNKGNYGHFCHFIFFLVKKFSLIEKIEYPRYKPKMITTFSVLVIDLPMNFLYSIKELTYRQLRNIVTRL